MNMIPMEYGGGLRCKTIETAAANQNYSVQLTTLKAKYNTLTDDEKERSFIERYNRKFMYVGPDLYVTTTLTNESLVIWGMDLSTKKHYQYITGSAGTSVIADGLDTAPLYLKILTDEP